jgi:hypothetical protein
MDGLSYSWDMARQMKIYEGSSLAQVPSLKSSRTFYQIRR